MLIVRVRVDVGWRFRILAVLGCPRDELAHVQEPVRWAHSSFMPLFLTLHTSAYFFH